jgi:hypothetical protein
MGRGFGESSDSDIEGREREAYPVVQHHLETFLAVAAETDPLGWGVPTSVERTSAATSRAGSWRTGSPACGALPPKAAASVPARGSRGGERGAFSVYASVRIEGDDRAGLERLVRCGARGPVALDRLYAPAGIASLAGPA